jgi:predicted RNA binding protein YcfA (HicA-like mRNA interferase family)
MPKLPRDCAPSDLIRFLKKRGWMVARQGAKHTLLRKGDDRTTVPRHGKLKTGTLRQILNQTGISIEDAAENL